MAKDKIVGYARVSTTDQNLERQLAQLEGMHVDKVFADKASGGSTDRPAFREMMQYVREGDELIVCSMDRFARNLSDLLTITKELHERGVAIRFLKENLFLDPAGEASPMAKMMLAMMGAVAEFERDLIRERQREGIEIAKAKGVYKGRKPLDPDLIKTAKARVQTGIPLARVCRDLKIGRTSLYRYIKNSQ